jgi:hypothetical protein
MQREVFSNTQLPAYDKVIANDEKISSYRLPEFLNSDAPFVETHHAQLGKILFQRAFLPILVHGSTPIVTPT